MIFTNAADRGRTGTGITTHGILSPGRLPIPPLRHNGWRWIRTTEAICSRFTVCPLWPLGNPSISIVRSCPTTTIYIITLHKMQEIFTWSRAVFVRRNTILFSAMLQYDRRCRRQGNFYFPRNDRIFF